MQVVTRPCPLPTDVSLGKRKGRSDDAVELRSDGRKQGIRLKIQDLPAKSVVQLSNFAQ